MALIYAHWEGFIKTASEYYLIFVGNQGHLYRDLKSCFSVFGLKGKLQILSDSRKAKPNIQILDFLLSELDNPARMKMGNAIDTQANLTSKVFSNIADSLDICTLFYEPKFNLIDLSLVNRRNKIAHGEYSDIELEEFTQLLDSVLEMLRFYKTDIENAASSKSYLRSTHHASMPLYSSLSTPSHTSGPRHFP